jgi:hypothetical protein
VAAQAAALENPNCEKSGTSDFPEFPEDPEFPDLDPLFAMTQNLNCMLA